MLQVQGKIDASRLERYLRRYPEEGYLWLACHAAFFVALTPGLLYRLWVNFKNCEQDKPLDIPLDAVPNLLASSLCRELGQGVYEIHESLRAPLLNQLRNDPRFGSPRLYRLANFLLAYLDYCGDELPSPAFAEAQRWTAEAYLQPERAAQRLLDAFSESVEGNVAGSAVEVYLNWVSHRGSEASAGGGGVDPLAAAEQLVKGIRNYQRGDREAAVETLRELSDYIQTEGSASPSAYRTKVPEDILALIHPGPEINVELAEQGVVYALLVGVGKVASGQASEMAGPANDLQLMKETLEGFIPEGELELRVLQDEQASKTNVLNSWQTLVNQANEEDHLFFYFSGHAYNKEEHYLILNDYEQEEAKEDYSTRTSVKGAFFASEFNRFSASSRAPITLVLDTHAGGADWLDLEKNGNIILSATLPGQMAYEQPFEEKPYGLFTRALAETLQFGRYASRKMVIREVARRMEEVSSYGQFQLPALLGNANARQLPLFWRKLGRNSREYFLLDLLLENGFDNDSLTASDAELIQWRWEDFVKKYRVGEQLDPAKAEDWNEMIGYLEKALLLKDAAAQGLSVAFPGMREEESGLFQLELGLEELLGIDVHINQKQEDNGRTAS